jgi:hypothetical protein
MIVLPAGVLVTVLLFVGTTCARPIQVGTRWSASAFYAGRSSAFASGSWRPIDPVTPGVTFSTQCSGAVGSGARLGIALSYEWAWEVSWR